MSLLRFPKIRVRSVIERVSAESSDKSWFNIMMARTFLKKLSDMQKDLSLLDSNSSVESDQGVDLWHERIGHVVKGDLRILPKGFINGSDVNTNLDVVECNACTDAKQTKTVCNDLLAAGREGYVLNSGIIGPIKVPSWGGSGYILTLIVIDY